MGEELNFNNIMLNTEIDDLFTSNDTSTEDTPEGQTVEEENTEEINTTEDDSVGEETTDNLESVGSGNNSKDKEAPSPDEKDDGTSPNFYSSIAKAFEEDGVFPDLSSDDIKNIVDAETLRAAIDKQIYAQLDEKQKRIDEALGVGVEPTQIQQYERTISYIDSITNESIEAETQEGEQLRKNLIQQDFLNRGYSKERAEREVQKSLNAGTDIEDAKEALNGNKEFFKEQYDRLIKEAKESSLKEEENRKKQAEALKKSMLEDDKVFGGIEIDANTRKRAYDSITKPVYKDPESGEYYTAIQKYEMDNHADFLKNVGLLFTLTDGFKNLDNVVKSKVRKEVSKGLRSLEDTLNNTSRNSDGSINFASGVGDSNTFFKGYNLDI